MAGEIKRLNIRSTHRFVGETGEEEINTAECECELSVRGDAILIRYSEGEGESLCSVRMHYSNGRLTVRREGAIRSTLTFEAGLRERGEYSAGGLIFDTETYTKLLDVNFDGGITEIKLVYEMKIAEALRETEMRISVS